MLSKRLLLVAGIVGCLLCLAASHSVCAQGFAPSTQVSSPFNFPRLGGGGYESDIITISDSMFPVAFNTLPHLKAGFVYSFGKHVRQGRATLDYLLPMDIFPATTVFGQFHGEFQDFWKSSRSRVVLAPAIGVGGLINVPIPSQQRYDLSIGGGIRRTVTSNSILGVNGFFDTTSLFDQWYSSGGVGLELFSRLPGAGLLDLQFNYYGNLFNRNDFINAFRNGAANFDLEAGYSQPLFNQAVDLRLKAVGYQFQTAQKVYGWRVGAEAVTRDGMFRLAYDYTQDRLSTPYHSIGGYVHLGLRLENLLRGENPLTMPEPIFAVGRNVSRIFHEPVRRNWAQPVQVVQRRGIPPLPPPPPPPPFLIFDNVTAVPFNASVTVQSVNVAAATFDLVDTDTDHQDIFLNYQFHMSDGSIQPVIATLSTVSDPTGFITTNEWSPVGTTSVGPAPMNAPVATTLLTFGQLHHLDLSAGGGVKTSIVTITIFVSGRPDIAPLVITCTVRHT